MERIPPFLTSKPDLRIVFGEHTSINVSFLILIDFYGMIAMVEKFVCVVS